MVLLTRKAAAVFAAAFLSLVGSAEMMRWQITGFEDPIYRLAGYQPNVLAGNAQLQACPAWSGLGMPGTPMYWFRQELLDVAGSPTATLREVLATGWVTLWILPKMVEVDDTAHR